MKKRNTWYLSTVTERAKRREYKELTSYQEYTFWACPKKRYPFFWLASRRVAGGVGEVSPTNKSFCLAFYKKRRKEFAILENMSPYDFMENEDNSTYPPSCNTGAENTLESGLIACVDWLQVTFKNEIGFKRIFDFLGLEKNDFTEINGLYGYPNGLTLNGIFIFYGARFEMGTHLQITGSGCRYLENYFTDFSWVDFFRRLTNFPDYNITRLDIALDDYKGIFTIDEIARKVKRGELISKFQKTIQIETIENSSGDSKGKTLYFGKPSSRLQIRMYEKNHERKNKGIDHDHQVWNRTELQLKKERAMKMFEIIISEDEEDFSKYVKGVLNNYMRFANRSKDENRSRWKTWAKWKKFIGEVEKIKLTHSEPEKDLIDTYLWLDKQASPSLAMMVKAGIDLNEFVLSGESRLTEIHLKKINDYIKKTQKSKSGQMENI